MKEFNETLDEITNEGLAEIFKKVSWLLCLFFNFHANHRLGE